METATQIEKVENLLNEVNITHRYSMSRIYGLYNEVFSKNETPQSCASCLIRKVRELKTWLDLEKAKQSDLNNSNVLDEEDKEESKETAKNKKKGG